MFFNPPTNILIFFVHIETNILGSLPLSIRRVLISEITGYLSPPSPGKQGPDPSIFASPAHVKWFMEVIGQGFNLPLEDMNITDDDVDIYSRWLFEQELRPAAVVNEGLEQEFYQIIFHQFSLLFQPRIAKTPTLPPRPPATTIHAATSAAAAASTTSNHSHQQQSATHNHTTSTSAARPATSSSTTTANNTNRNNTPFHINMIPVSANNVVPVSYNPPPVNNSNTNNPGNSSQQSGWNSKESLAQLVQRHIELCKKTLKVFAMAGRTLKLSAESWTVLLKVMLGITDYLLKEPIGTSNSGVMNMADELCDSLLQVCRCYRKSIERN